MCYSEVIPKLPKFITATVCATDITENTLHRVNKYDCYTHCLEKKTRLYNL